MFESLDTYRMTLQEIQNAVKDSCQFEADFKDSFQFEADFKGFIDFWKRRQYVVIAKDSEEHARCEMLGITFCRHDCIAIKAHPNDPHIILRTSSEKRS